MTYLNLKTAAMAALGVVALGTGAIVTNGIVNVPAAYAQTDAKAVVDSAIAAGRIGETIGGYLAAVGSISEEERRAMNTINISRKSVYTDLAQKRGVSVDVVARLIGEKQIAKAAAGTKIMTESGQWSTK